MFSVACPTTCDSVPVQSPILKSMTKSKSVPNEANAIVRIEANAAFPTVVVPAC